MFKKKLGFLLGVMVLLSLAGYVVCLAAGSSKHIKEEDDFLLVTSFYPMYVLAENKGMTASECIDKSKAITDGYKGELFVLGLSFIGWALLGGITFGIAFIWIMPYMQTTYANAYRYLNPVASNQVNPGTEDAIASEM